jgi:hypothetical protein
MKINVSSRAEADSAWQLLQSQWDVDRAEVTLNQRPLYQFSRSENGCPQLTWLNKHPKQFKASPLRSSGITALALSLAFGAGVCIQPPWSASTAALAAAIKNCAPKQLTLPGK